MGLNKSTLSEQIYDILRDNILHQDEIHCGDKLTLKVLQERFNVSSTPIREALTRLSQDGLITYYSNIGVNVIQLTQKDLQDLYTFIADLDSLAIKYAANSPMLDELKEKLTVLIKTAKKKTATNHLKEWQKFSDDFHLIFYEYCDNSKLIESANRIRSQLTIFSSQYESQGDVQVAIQSEHEDIYAAFMDGDITKSVSLMTEHMKHSYDFACKYLYSASY